MSLTQEQIKKLSNFLSKIEINNEKIPGDINNILKYIDLLWEVDTTWVLPTNSVINCFKELREDDEIQKKVTREELLKCSNQRIIQDQIAVSNIM